MTEAIIRNDIGAITFMVTWNNNCLESGVDFEKVFDLNFIYSNRNFHSLHLASMIPSLSMIIDLTSSKFSKVINLDWKLALPSKYIKQGFLSSKKAMVKAEIKQLNKIFTRDVNKEDDITITIPDSRNFLDFQKIYKTKKKYIRNRPPTIPIKASTGGNEYGFGQLSTPRLDDTEENVRINAIPMSIASIRKSCQVSQISKGRDSFGKRSHRGSEIGMVRGSSILSRGSEMDMPNNRVNDKLIEGIKKKMSQIFSEFNSFFNDIYFSFHHRNLKEGMKIDLNEILISKIRFNFKQLWIRVNQIITCLRILKGIIKTQLNFPKQSHTYKNLKKMVEYLVKMVKVMSSKLILRENNFLLSKSIEVLVTLVKEIYKIPTLSVKTNKFMIACTKYLYYANKGRRDGFLRNSIQNLSHKISEGESNEINLI